jgi:hypothetical protein
LKKIFGLSRESGYKPSYRISAQPRIYTNIFYSKEPYIMNKTLFYLIVTVVGLVTLSLIWYPAADKQTVDGATPADGLVGETTEQAVTPEEAPVMEQAPAAAQEAAEDAATAAADAADAAATAAEDAGEAAADAAEDAAEATEEAAEDAADAAEEAVQEEAPAEEKAE